MRLHGGLILHSCCPSKDRICLWQPGGKRRKIDRKGWFLKEFAQFRLDTENQSLRRHAEVGDGERLQLTPKAFAVLEYLVERAGRLVTRDELIAAIWPDAAVEPGALDNQILNIRNALGDNPKNPVYIETLPRRGYRFIAPVKDSAANGSACTPRGKLVGRETELAELGDSLDQALNYQRQIVFITGEAGIGKTALADEFQRRAAGAAGIRIARGQCVEGFGGKEPYYPMLDALGQLCRGPGGEAVIRVLDAQAPMWLVQFPALIQRERREMLQREILGATRERMLREIGDALDTLASSAPMLVVLEDLRWADASTVDLIAALARRRGPAKLMILGTYRPADVELENQPLMAVTEQLTVHRLCREIALRPLTVAEIAEYLSAGGAETARPGALAELLYRRSEGNPLYMVAALEHLSERGLISREQGEWRLRVPLEKIDLGVPESLGKMIEAQIDRLTAEEQRVLEAASPVSVGRKGFLAAARAAIIEMEPEAFESVCEGLSRPLSVVRPSPPETVPEGIPPARYEFVHELYREVCYRRIPPGRRMNLHRRLGEWIEQNLPPGSTTAAWLADHFEHSQDWRRAIRYLQAVAETAGQRCAFREVARILKHALELAGKLPEEERTASEIEILDKLAGAYAALVDSPHAVETYEALVERAAHGGLVNVETRALIHMAWALSWVSSQRSLEVLERALQMSARQEDALLRARTRARCFAKRLWLRWDPRDAAAFGEAFAEIRKMSNPGRLTTYWADWGFIHWISSEYREANRLLLKSGEIGFEALKDNPYLSFSYLVGQRFVLPVNHLFLGEWGGAVRALEEAIAQADKNADCVWGQVVRLCLALVHLHAMDFAGALKICNSVFPLGGDPEAARAPGDPAPYPIVFRMWLSLTGWAHTGLENYAGALECLAAAGAAIGNPSVAWDWWWRMPQEAALTELCLAKGDLAQARPQAERFLAIALATAERTYQALAWEVNARAAMAAEDWKRAEECVAKALATIEGCELPVAAWRVHGTAAQLYARGGEGCAAGHPAAEHHRELSRAVILKLANSVAENSLRETMLAAPAVRKITG